MPKSTHSPRPSRWHNLPNYHKSGVESGECDSGPGRSPARSGAREDHGSAFAVAPQYCGSDWTSVGHVRLSRSDDVTRMIPRIKMFTMGQSVAKSQLLSTKLAPNRRSFADTTRDFVTLGSPRHGEVFDLGKFESIEPEASLTARTGQTVRVYCAALGKVIRGGMADNQRRQVVCHVSARG